MSRWHPWRSLRQQPHVTMEIDDLPPGVLGVTFHRSRTIKIARDLLQRERRSVLAHELVHLERGPCPPSAVEEHEVEAEAARRLIPLDDLVAALLWSQNETELAEELWVDEAMVRARLASLTTGERTAIERRFADAEAAVSAVLTDDGELSSPPSTVTS